MKKILSLLLFFTISLSYSQDWKLLFKSDNETYYYKPNNDETAWIKVTSNKTEYHPSKVSSQVKIVDGYKIILWKFDCSKKKIGVIKSTIYSKDGKNLESYSQNELLVDMDYANPDSIGEALLRAFCE